MSTQTAPYGSWKSPVTPQIVTQGSLNFSILRWDGDDLYWLEFRPEERGRGVILRWSSEDGIREITGSDVSVGTRVHEIGGGDFAVRDGILYYVDARDQRIYRQVAADGLPEGAPSVVIPVTPESVNGTVRFGDIEISPDGRWLFAVRETHPGATPESSEWKEARNDLVRIPADGSGAPTVISEGHDFFSFPRISPDGKKLAFTSWDHPRMPWDGTDLWVADVNAKGQVGTARHIAGGPEESIFQPEWSPDGRLHFSSDRTGWWNIYEWVELENDQGGGNPSDEQAPTDCGSEGREGRIHRVTSIEAEIGTAQWVLGLSHFAFLGDRIACVFASDGIDHLGFLDPHGAHPDVVRRARFPFTYYGRGGSIVSNGRNQIAFIAASSQMPPTIARLVVPADLTTMEFPHLVHASADIEIDPSNFSRAESIEFPTQFGRTAHALYYPPTNPAFQGPEGELPPLLVKSHGGPTACSTSELALGAQFWTSRGFAVIDVNYGGSTGYGRAYRMRLDGQWGVVDTEDCIAAAKYLAERGLVDGKRMAIRGGSAGGFTTLCALVFHDVFAAGASAYGIADLEALASDTHKFESRYLDRMVGPYPEAKQTYVERSPIHYVDKLSCPVILLHGTEDKVVPPAQSEIMAKALDEKGIPYALVLFEGERHGFRDAKNIQRALEAEYLFYAKVFGFEPADDFEPLEVKGL
ncbi:MAG: S9 family peptidase [Candidatus Eisenbacteria bacterium]|uniref:S9 family peptidase n=1 Tax=Eiseniibacteriota bacterium TaxID=2212470 RepID=A0A956NFP8_UNCEI|nr:S9 family peptidase [Candidatus Eisenbacteria bacterium]MCB9466171.1 S9 family peptidase [Candidatus Eisenbacteria bacterium]